MKKLLAVIMSIVMMFTLAVLPVAAAEEAQEEDTITMQEVVDTVELTIALIKDTIKQVHFIVGSILGALEKECPLCGEIHVWESTDGEVEDGEVEEGDSNEGEIGESESVPAIPGEAA